MNYILQSKEGLNYMKKLLSFTKKEDKDSILNYLLFDKNYNVIGHRLPAKVENYEELFCRMTKCENIYPIGYRGQIWQSYL